MTDIFPYQFSQLKVDDDYPKNIVDNWGGWPESWLIEPGVTRLDAALHHPNGKFYFFRGSEYCRYDPKRRTMDDDYPRNIVDVWTGWPSSWINDDGETRVDAAFYSGSKRKVYFFKGDEYIRYAPGVGVDDDYPKITANEFNGWHLMNVGSAKCAVSTGSRDVVFMGQGRWAGYRMGHGNDGGGIMPQSPDGWPTGTQWDNPDAGLDSTKWGRCYIFKGSQYLRLSRD